MSSVAKSAIAVKEMTDAAGSGMADEDQAKRDAAARQALTTLEGSLPVFLQAIWDSYSYRYVFVCCYVSFLFCFLSFPSFDLKPFIVSCRPFGTFLRWILRVLSTRFVTER